MNIEHKEIFTPPNAVTNEELLKNKEMFLLACEQVKEQVGKEIEEILSDCLNIG